MSASSALWQRMDKDEDVFSGFKEVKLLWGCYRDDVRVVLFMEEKLISGVSLCVEEQP